MRSNYLITPAKTTTQVSTFRKALLTLMIMLFATLPLMGMIGGKANAENFDYGKFVFCNLLKGSETAQLFYRVNMTDELNYQLRSKSAYGSTLEKLDTFYNGLLTVTGSPDFNEVNEKILGRKLFLSGASEAEQTAKEEDFNGGEHVTPYDRFGMAGLTFSGYLGEWKYFQIDPCAERPEPRDTKTNLFYEGRLVPQSTWDGRETSIDIRSNIHYSNGLTSDFLNASLNVASNFTFGITKLLVALTLAFINLSFTDIASLVGINTLLSGDPATGSTGIFGVLFDNIFMGFILIVFAATGFRIFWMAFAKRQVRGAMTDLLRSIALFMAAIIISTSPMFWTTLPNKLSILLQSVLVTSVSASLDGGNELCSLDYTTNDELALYDDEITDVTDEKTNIGIIEQAGNNAKSAIGCSFWQMLLFKPWAEAQFGTDWMNLWAQDKVPDWVPLAEGETKESKSIVSGDDNREMVGDGFVPLGGGEGLNNWALFQLSTQTNAHAPIGKETETGQFSNGRNNDWWRIVDLLVNYEEEESKYEMTTTPSAPTTPPDSETQTPEVAVGTVPTSVDSLQKYYNNGSRITMEPTPPSVHWLSTTRTLSGNYSGHTGIDLSGGGSEGHPLYAAKPGKVDYVGTGRGYGVAVFITFDDGYRSVYGHMMTGSPTVKAGDRVQAGQQIGKLGNTGRSSGPHLHFEVAPPGGKLNRVSNRVTTINWLYGFEGKDVGSGTAGAPTSSGPMTSVSGGNAFNLVYGVPKANPVSPYFDHWAGQEPFDRFLTSASSVAFALVALSSPTLFAILSAVYGIGLSLVVAVSPIALLAGCWGGRGWQMFIQWFGLLVNTIIKRLITAFLMIISLILTSTILGIMQTDGWWKGMLLMILMSIILIMSRHKIIEMLSVVNMSSGRIVQSASGVLKRSGGFARKGGTVAANFVGADLAARHYIKEEGIGHDKELAKRIRVEGRNAAIEQEFRNISYRNRMVRYGMTAFDKQNERVSKYCHSCGSLLKDTEGLYKDEYQNWYCNDCGIDNSELDYVGLNEANDEYLDPRIQVNSAYDLGRSQQVVRRINRVSGRTDDEIMSDGSLSRADRQTSQEHWNDLVNVSAQDMKRNITATKQLGDASLVKFAEIPQFLQPYMNMEEYEKAKKKLHGLDSYDDNVFLDLRKEYVEAMISYAYANVELENADGDKLRRSRIEYVRERIGVSSAEELELLRNNKFDRSDTRLLKLRERYIKFRNETYHNMLRDEAAADTIYKDTYTYIRDSE